MFRWFGILFLDLGLFSFKGLLFQGQGLIAHKGVIFQGQGLIAHKGLHSIRYLGLVFVMQLVTKCIFNRSLFGVYLIIGCTLFVQITKKELFGRGGKTRKGADISQQPALQQLKVILLQLYNTLLDDRSSCVASIHKGILMSHKLVFHTRAAIGHERVNFYQLLVKIGHERVNFYQLLVKIGHEMYF